MDGLDGNWGLCIIVEVIGGTGERERVVNRVNI